MQQTLKYESGFSFFNYQMHQCVVHSFSEQYNCYLVKEGENSIALNFWNESDIDRVMSKQEQMLEYDKQQKELQRIEADKQQKEIDEYNNVFGYCDNMSDLQKGKVLKTLNKQQMICGKIVARKTWIKESLENGEVPTIKYNVYSSRSKVKPVVYAIESSVNKTWIEITKTEYDYAAYLIKNNII